MSNEFKDISASVGQLSSQLSNFQKTQLNAVSSVTGAINRVGNINGNISQSISRLNNTINGAIDVSARIAGSLENAGVALSNSSKFLSDIVNRSNVFQSNIFDEHTLPPVNISDMNVRLPSRNAKTSASEEIQKKKETVVGTGAGSGVEFPADLTTVNDVAYLQLKFQDYTRGGAFSEGSVSGGASIYLPLPENYNQFFSIKYDQRDTGLLGEALGRASQDTKDAFGKGQIGEGFASLMKSAQNTTGEQAAQSIKDIAQRELLAGLDSADDVVGGLAGSLAGAIPNPHPTVFFKGLNLRQFTWNWKLVPRNAQDAESMRRILYNLRTYILPSSSGATLTYPKMVTPIPQGKGASRLGNFKRCMVSQMTINYTGEGTSAFFVDGSPVSVALTMEFTEIENYTQQDVKGTF